MFTFFFVIYLFLNDLFGACSSSTLVINVVEVGSNNTVTLPCHVSSSTTLTRWTYLAGLTGTSYMNDQYGTCTVSPSDNFLGYKYSNKCNSTIHQISLPNADANINNRIVACRDAVQLDGSGSTWMIKVVAGTPCTYCRPPITFKVQEVTEGDNLTFICRVPFEVPYVNWDMNIGKNKAAINIHNGQCNSSIGTTFLDNKSKYANICNDTVSQVTVLNVQRSEHNDMYMCTAPTQQEGAGSNWIIKVQVPVTLVTLTPTDNQVDVIENTVIKFTCETPPSRPAASVYWYRHPHGNRNDITPITEKITITPDYNDFRVTTSILRLVPSRQDNNMKIFCTANNSVYTSPVKSNERILLNILYPPTVPEMKNISKHTDEELKVNCLYTAGVPAPTSVRWTRDIDDTQWDGEQLYISSLTRSDAGYYYCNASNVMKPRGDNKSHIGHSTHGFYLDVLYDANISSFTIEGKQVVTVNESDQIRFVCNADSNPDPLMTLNHNIKMLKITRSDTLEYNITNGTCLDAGIYFCHAKNAYNGVVTSAKFVQLFVLCQPRAAKDVDMNIKSDTGVPITIVVDVIAYPSPTFKWHQLVNSNWTLLEDNDKYSITSSAVQSNLTILGVSENDFTSYKMVAENDQGHFEQIYSLSPYGADDSTSPGPLIGGIVGGVIGIAVLVAIGVFIIRRKPSINGCFTEPTEIESNPENEITNQSYCEPNEPPLAVSPRGQNSAVGCRTTENRNNTSEDPFEWTIENGHDTYDSFEDVKS